MAQRIVGPHGPAVGGGRMFTPLLGLGILLLLAAPLQAGPVFVAGQLDGDKFTPAPGVAASWYHIRYSTSDVSVEDEVARVQVEEIITGPEKAVQAVCI